MIFYYLQANQERGLVALVADLRATIASSELQAYATESEPVAMLLDDSAEATIVQSQHTARVDGIEVIAK